MRKFYKKPKGGGGNKKEHAEDGEFHICKLDLDDWTDEEEQEAEKGRKVAEENRIKKSRHIVDEFLWGRNLNFKKGDSILQIINERDKTYVSPICKLIHIRKWSNGKITKYCCFVEVPDKRRKNLEVVQKQLNQADAKSIERAGKKSLNLEAALKNLWK